MPADSSSSTRVVIAGGGVAAIEALLAFRALTPDGGPQLTLVAASPVFRLPPLSALKPFGRGHSDELSLAEVAAEHGAAFVERRVAAVDPERRVLILSDGGELEYDELILAVGGQPVKGTDRGTGFDPGAHNSVSGIASDLELGWAESVAVVVPEPPTWPIPGYEFALQLAAQAGDTRGRVHLFIPDDEPLGFFGPQNSAAVRQLLDEAGVELHTGTIAHVTRNGVVQRDGHEPLQVDRVLAVPRIVGPAIQGLPQNELGFIEVDARGRIGGVEHVRAAGDGTNLPIKFGGLACQQADAAVADLLSSLGYAVDAEPFDPVYDALLVAGDRELPLHWDPSGADRPAPQWFGGSKVAGRYLTAYLEAKGITHLAHREPAQ